MLFLFSLANCSKNESGSKKIKKIVIETYTSSGKTLVTSITTEFDSKGNETRIESIKNPSGEELKLFTYDAKDRLIEIEYHYKNPKISGKEKFAYFKNDSLKSHLFYDLYGNLHSAEINEYSTDFKKKKSSFYKENKLIWQNNYQYSGKHRTVFDESIWYAQEDSDRSRTIITEYLQNYRKQKTFDFKGKLEFTSYDWYKNNKLIRNKTFDAKNKLIEEEIRKYDLAGNQVYCLFIHHQEKTRELYQTKYDRSGNEIEKVFSYAGFGEKDNNATKTINVYDKYNNPVQKREYFGGKLMNIFTHKYEYDTKGNWILDIDSEFKMWCKRKITYY